MNTGYCRLAKECVVTYSMLGLIIRLSLKLTTYIYNQRRVSCH